MAFETRFTAYRRLIRDITINIKRIFSFLQYMFLMYANIHEVLFGLARKQKTEH